MGDNEKCPFCDEALIISPANKGHQTVYLCACEICGDFEYPNSNLEEIRSLLFKDGGDKNYENILKERKALLSHTILKNQRKPTKTDSGLLHHPVEVDGKFIKQVIENSSLPNTPQDLADNLIRWVGNNSSIGEATDRIILKKLQAIIGASSEEAIYYILEKFNYVEAAGGGSDGNVSFIGLKLEPKGWERFEELKRGTIESKKVFMVMQFEDKKKYGLSNMFERFEKAVEQTGFKLFSALTEPKVGSIPDNIIIDILKSKFIVADLSYDNLNVYWEAGYAEGLKKQVVYTCEEKSFEERPFDIRHKQTIKWNEKNLDKAAEELKAVIRGTFPDIAQLEDKNIEI